MVTKACLQLISMSIFEYDEERELKLIREAEYQSGVEDGIEIGRKEGFSQATFLNRLAFIKIMKRTLKDFEFIYHEIKEEEIFSTLSKEEIKSLFEQT